MSLPGFGSYRHLPSGCSASYRASRTPGNGPRYNARTGGDNTRAEWTPICHKSYDDDLVLPTPTVVLHRVAACDQCAQQTKVANLCNASHYVREDLLVASGGERGGRGVTGAPLADVGCQALLPPANKSHGAPTWPADISLRGLGFKVVRNGLCQTSEIDAETVLSGGNDNQATNLKACIGECDRDTQCATRLKCFQRENTEAIPGCTGSGRSEYDYCYDPSFPAPAKNLSDCIGRCRNRTDTKCGYVAWQPYTSICKM